MRIACEQLPLGRGRTAERDAPEAVLDCLAAHLPARAATGPAQSGRSLLWSDRLSMRRCGRGSSLLPPTTDLPQALVKGRLAMIRQKARRGAAAAAHFKGRVRRLLTSRSAGLPAAVYIYLGLLG